MSLRVAGPTGRDCCARIGGLAHAARDDGPSGRGSEMRVHGKATKRVAVPLLLGLAVALSLWFGSRTPPVDVEASRPSAPPIAGAPFRLAPDPGAPRATPSFRDGAAATEKTRALRVRVASSQDGSPIEGATVRAYAGAGGATDYPGFVSTWQVVGEARTGAGGTAVVTVEGASRIPAVGVVRDGFAPRIQPLPTGEAGEVSILLDPGRALGGRVEDARGQGVVGVTVRARGLAWPVPAAGPVASGVDGEGLFETTTGPDGGFRIEGLAEGWFALSVIGNGVRELRTKFGRPPQRLTYRAGDTSITLKTQQVLAYRLQFIDAGTRAPIPYEAISLKVLSAQAQTLGLTMESIETGVPGEHAGLLIGRPLGETPRTLNVDCYAEGYAPGQGVLRLRGPRDDNDVAPDRVELRAEPPRVTGILLIRESLPDGLGPPPERRVLNVGADFGSSVGRLTLFLSGKRLADGEWQFEGVPAGEVSVSLGAETFSSTRMTVHVEPGARTLVKIPLGADQGAVLLDLQEEGGRALFDAASLGVREATREGPGMSLDPAITRFRSDAEGRVIRPTIWLVPGTYRITVTKPGWSPAYANVVVEPGKVATAMLVMVRTPG